MHLVISLQLFDEQVAVREIVCGFVCREEVLLQFGLDTRKDGSEGRTGQSTQWSITLE